MQEKPWTVVYGGEGGAWLEDRISFRLEWLLGVLLTLVGLRTFALFGRLWTDWVSRASRRNTPINTRRDSQLLWERKKCEFSWIPCWQPFSFSFMKCIHLWVRFLKELHWALMYLCCCAIWIHRKYRLQICPWSTGPIDLFVGQKRVELGLGWTNNWDSNLLQLERMLNSTLMESFQYSQRILSLSYRNRTHYNLAVIAIVHHHATLVIQLVNCHLMVFSFQVLPAFSFH